MGSNGQFVLRSVRQGAKHTVTVDFRGKTVFADTGNPANAAFRKKFTKGLADCCPAVRGSESEIDSELLRQVFTIHNEKQPDDAEEESTPENASALDARIEEQLGQTSKDVVDAAKAMLADVNLVNRILADIAACGVVGEQELSLSIYLITTSRLLARPLAGIVQGLSSSGKSYVIETVARCVPAESVVQATDMSAQALYYLPAGSLVHRAVVAGEKSRKQDDDTAEKPKSLREMISSGCLNKVVTVSVGGKLTTKRIYQPGPVAYIESTTLTTIFDEDANRCLLLSTDEGRNQTRAIMQAAAHAASQGTPDQSLIFTRQHAMQRLLKRVVVKIPFAAKLENAFPDNRPTARRAFNHMLDMIRAVALLHQYQRERDTDPIEHDTTIQAELSDYAVAKRLLVGPLGRSMGGSLSPSVAKFGHWICGQSHYGMGFSTTDASRGYKDLKRPTVVSYLDTLAEAGVVELVQQGKGNQASQWKVIGDVPAGGADWLPGKEAFK